MPKVVRLTCARCSGARKKGTKVAKTDDNSPPTPGECEACAKVMRHAVKYLDGTDCGFHPGIEGVIRQGIEAEARQVAAWLRSADAGAMFGSSTWGLRQQLARGIEEGLHRNWRSRVDLQVTHWLVSSVSYCSALYRVDDVVPPRKGEKMAKFTSVTVTAAYHRASGQVTLKVEAWGEDDGRGIELEEIQARSDCYRQGTVLCVQVKRKLSGEHEPQPWSAQATYNRSADFVVLQFGGDGYVMSAGPVDKI